MKCTDAHPNSPVMGKNWKGFADLTHTNMCYRCDYCDQGYQNIYWLTQIALNYFICDNCKKYYKLTREVVDSLKYVETREEWNDAEWCDSKMFFPYPIGFNT